MPAWLHVVGIGEDGLPGLNPAARTLIDSAEVLVGGKRHLAMVGDETREQLTWPTPFDALIPELEARRGRRVCVLATGDPSCYGVGVTLSKHFHRSDMHVVPGPSAFSLACARLGWSLPDVETLSLHGRPVSLLQPFVQPQAKLLLLSHDRQTPHQVAQLLVDRGYGDSPMTVLEHLSGTRERLIEGVAGDWHPNEISDFNTLAVECVAQPGSPLLARTPGLPDEAFHHDGKLTKRAVRASTLAALSPISGQLLWDVGAGCGSISIEWMRAAPRGRAIAIEREMPRLSLIAQNAQALGTPHLRIIEGDAPMALRELAPPDAIFIGGGITTDGLIDQCWQALKLDGRLVANTVTLEGEAVLAHWHQAVGGELTRIVISHVAPLGAHRGFKASMPITQYCVIKT